MNFLEQVINILVAGAIGLTVVKTYLTANKVWSRKHKQAVAESISVSAQLIGILTSVPFLIKYAMIDGDFMSLANIALKLGLTLFFLAIGIGIWVRVDGYEGFWSKIKRSLKLEKEESLDLINAIVRPAGARKILDVLRGLAMIDKEVDEREMLLIEAFAERWNIKIDFREEFESANDELTDQMHITLREQISDYLNISPDKTQASQFLDIINSLVSADENISKEEQFIVDEIKGMIDSYINDGQSKICYNVIVVPQDSEERASIRALLPNVTPREEWGGIVYYAGVYYSRPFAQMISERYQHLNLFSTVKTVRQA
jgi:hypothetical protein